MEVSTHVATNLFVSKLYCLIYNHSIVLFNYILILSYCSCMPCITTRKPCCLLIIMYIHVFIVGVSMDVSLADPLCWISVRVSSYHSNMVVVVVHAE